MDYIRQSVRESTKGVTSGKSFVFPEFLVVSGYILPENRDFFIFALLLAVTCDKKIGFENYFHHSTQFVELVLLI